MSENSNQIKQYLKSEEIFIDYNEFLFQFNSHPDFPSLLSMSDTLTFFKITNGAFRVNFHDIGKLPDRFLTSLKIEGKDVLIFLTKLNGDYVYYNETNKEKRVLQTDELKNVWQGIVLLIENNYPRSKRAYKSKPLVKSFYFLTIGLLLGSVLLLQNRTLNLHIFSFFLTSAVGLLFSLFVFKNIFTINTHIINKFCSLTATETTSTGCDAILSSSHGKIFNLISFSDLSITFFATQIFGLFLFDQMELMTSYFVIQNILIIFSLPLIVSSLYIQKFVEKNWCPICLAIIGVLFLESIIINAVINVPFNISIYPVLLYLLIFFSVFGSWFYFRKGSEELKRLKDFEVKANRFKRTYSIFKNSLFNSTRYQLPDSDIVLGNVNAKLNFTLVTSPFCGHCEGPYNTLKSIVEKHHDDISLTILFNIHPENERLRLFSESLVNGQLMKDDNFFFKSMDTWYRTKDFRAWLDKYGKKGLTAAARQKIIDQRLWLTKMDFNFTPVLFINGFYFPEAYEIHDIKHLIEELMDEYNKNQPNPQNFTRSTEEAENLTIE